MNEEYYKSLRNRMDSGEVITLSDHDAVEFLWRDKASVKEAALLHKEVSILREKLERLEKWLLTNVKERVSVRDEKGKEHTFFITCDIQGR